MGPPGSLPSRLRPQTALCLRRREDSARSGGAGNVQRPRGRGLVIAVPQSCSLPPADKRGKTPQRTLYVTFVGSQGPPRRVRVSASFLGRHCGRAGVDGSPQLDRAGLPSSPAPRTARPPCWFLLCLPWGTNRLPLNPGEFSFDEVVGLSILRPCFAHSHDLRDTGTNGFLASG